MSHPTIYSMQLKRRALYLFLFLLPCLCGLKAQGLPHDSIAEAFRRGNAEALARHLEPRISFIVDDSTSTLERARVTSRLRVFFIDHKVQSLKINHQSSRENSSFVVMTLVTNNGQYRVNCFLRKPKEQYLIHQIRIERTNE